ncbi:metal ABC transporter ATP-binding protein [Piscinibacter sp.]|uniref:metal ABC transporter ATP-binding protein n=1 Tax=Piscinibacter sp. TaxID=1903157 RepID=UPI002C3ABBB4|nr:metal ABC transporter ATP-binding protein [Albitalea sp.]HUG24691.1 metal ABC transporter ATP-binding protein [Albitalea sp.]
MTTLIVFNLSAGYGAARVLDGVSFVAHGGQRVAIVGPNGVGKSTLVKVLLGLLPAARGSVALDGRPITAQPQRVAYVPQRAEIDWDYPTTTAEMVAMGTSPRHGMGWLRRPTQLAAGALARVGLQAQASCPIGELSGGQRQRALLARALLRKADLIVLDEPLAAVDRTSEVVIWAELTRLSAAGALVIVVHHDLAAARAQFDACLLLAPGSALFGPPADVLKPSALDRAYGRCVAASGEMHAHRGTALCRAA